MCRASCAVHTRFSYFVEVPLTAPQSDLATSIPEDAITDPAPALETVSPEFGKAEEPDIDLSDLPEFRSLQGSLPSARFRVKRQLADVQKVIPKAWLEGETPDEQETIENLGEMEELFVMVENLVLDRAKDREAMAAWLCAQEEGESALMAAFGVLAEQLGN